MNNKKSFDVGLVTLYSDNYGSCLQAFSLNLALKKLGLNPTLIRYIPFSNGGGAKKKHGQLYKLLHRPLWNTLSLLINYKSITRQKAAFNHFRNTQFVFTNESYGAKSNRTGLNDKYDVFVCGSDMMWCETFEKDWEQYFLQFASKEKRISYAPSFGVNKISDLNFERCGEYLKGFNSSCLSCRDTSGVEMIEKDFGLKAHHAVDPTMLLSKNEWCSLLPDDKLINKPYVLLYLFGGYEGNRKNIFEQVKKWGIGDIKAIDINSKYKIKTTIGPFEYVRLFRDASYVITDTFHGLMFSLIFEKPFVLLTREDGLHWANYSDRMTSQLDMLGISERYHDMNKPLPESFRLLDYSNISPKLHKLRNDSLSYLSNALDEVVNLQKD